MRVCVCVCKRERERYSTNSANREIMTKKKTQGKKRKEK